MVDWIKVLQVCVSKRHSLFKSPCVFPPKMFNAFCVLSHFEVYLSPVITVHPERLHHAVPDQPPGIALAHQSGLGGRGGCDYIYI